VLLFKFLSWVVSETDETSSAKTAAEGTTQRRASKAASGTSAGNLPRRDSEGTVFSCREAGGRRAAAVAAAHLPKASLIEVEQITQKAFAFSRLAAMFALAFAEFVIVIVVVIVPAFRVVRKRAFDDLVQFTTIQPDASAQSAVVNFHALTVCDA
jgi:hypothetical protein